MIMNGQVHRDYFFEDTVIDFYQNSNEVDEFYNVCKQHIISEISTQNKPLKWLDVGIGNGEKVLRILSLFKENPSITFIEPSNRWVNELTISGNLDKIRVDTLIKGFHRTFEDFVQFRNDFDFDLISFIQVLYEPYLVDALFDFIDKKQNIKPFHLLINLENDDNDLFKIRKLISHKNIDVPISQLSKIEKELKERKIELKKFNSTQKLLNISINEIIQSDNHWFYPFILGISKLTYSKLDTIKKDFIKKEIDKFLSSQHEININDTTLIAHIKNGTI